MCIFAGLGIAAGIQAAAAAAGSIVSALGSIWAGQSQQAVADYNAQVATNNATAEHQRGAYESGLVKDEVNRTIGSQRAAFASAGIGIESGTPLAVFGDTAKQGELDILARMHSADVAATAYRNDAQRFRAEGKAAAQAGYIGAGTSLLSGIGRVAGAANAQGRYKPLELRR